MRIYSCYLLLLQNAQRAAGPNGPRTYVGISTDVARRLRQHNGELVGGATSTRLARGSTGVWVLKGFVQGFPDRSLATSFESAVKNKRPPATGPAKRRERMNVMLAEWNDAHQLCLEWCEPEHLPAAPLRPSRSPVMATATAGKTAKKVVVRATGTATTSRGRGRPSKAAQAIEEAGVDVNAVNKFVALATKRAAAAASKAVAAAKRSTRAILAVETTRAAIKSSTASKPSPFDGEPQPIGKRPLKRGRPTTKNRKAKPAASKLREAQTTPGTATPA